VSDEVDEELPPFNLVGTVAPVALGGAVGTLLRALILDAATTSGSWHAAAGFHGAPNLDASWLQRAPWSLLLINTLGVFGAAWLLWGPLRHRSPDNRLRLFTVTGLLGGFTSYSSLFVDLAWIKQASLLGAVLTVVVALAAGVGAAALGVRVATR
jgi:fluoride ion exporter CrcB/FEX